MTRKPKFSKKLMKILHKVARYTKEQKIFVIYLLVLTFFLVFFPIVKVVPTDIGQDGYSVWLLSGSFFKTMVVVFISLGILLGRNMSFRFKNIVINLFGFRENDALFNFGLLWIMTTALLSIGDTIHVFRDVTSTVQVTSVYYIDQLLLLLGLVLTLMVVIKKVKRADKAKIVNIVNKDAMKEVKNKKSLEGLFDD